MLLANNVLLVVAAAAVLLGTLYPLFIDALGLGKLSVGPPYFESVFVPLVAPALFLMGVGPLARWKKASLPEMAVRLRLALAVSAAAAVAAPLVMGSWTPMIGFGVLLATWILCTTLFNLYGRLAQHRNAGWLQRVAAQPAGYYGMLLAHCGVAVFIFGVTLVKGYETAKDVRMQAGGTATVGGYTFRFETANTVQGPNYAALRATIGVTRDGQAITTMYPEKRIYAASNTPTTEAAIAPGFTRDLYVSLGEPLPDGAWAVRIHHKPFVDWIWGGCLLMALGGFLAVCDRRYRLARAASPQAAAAAVPQPGSLPAFAARAGQ
jgi:cytochrome c-type biogenesis protein CcmF